MEDNVDDITDVYDDDITPDLDDEPSLTILMMMAMMMMMMKMTKMATWPALTKAGASICSTCKLRHTGGMSF